MYNIANLVNLIPYSRFQFEPHPSFQVPNSKSQITHSIFPIQIPHSTFHFPNLCTPHSIFTIPSPKVFKSFKYGKYENCVFPRDPGTKRRDLRGSSDHSTLHVPNHSFHISHFNYSFHITISHSTFQSIQTSFHILHSKSEVPNPSS